MSGTGGHGDGHGHTGGAPASRRAYIGSFTAAGGRGITAVDVDPGTGALSSAHHTDVVPNPSWLHYVPGAGERAEGLLYAVSETPEGGAAVLAPVDGGAPTLLGAVTPVDGADPTHLTLLGGLLHTANYSSGSVSSLPLREDGTLVGTAAVLRHQGSGPNAERQEGPHAHAVLPDPTGRWLLSVDLGTDSVRVCRPGTATHPPEVHREEALRPGSGPRHLAFAPDGHRAYVINELDSTVTTCDWEPEAGRLTPLAQTRVLPADAPEADGNYPSGLVIAPDGRFAWAANRGADRVAVLDLRERDGVPRLVTTVPCGGHWPRGLALDPSGRRLYVANERSGDVTWFDLDPGDGLPVHAGSLTAPAASCVVFG